ncbi:MAG: YheV family putative metal-binding protein [Pseudomonadota bacterium]
MHGTQPPKRFIAGAVCTRCGAMDRTMMHHADGKIIKECVGCGHTEALDELGQSGELQTRVSPEPAQDETTVIKIIKP